MAKSKHYYIRKTHRWLGLALGIQFLFWTIGGLYFSWTNIDEVHGDFQKKSVPLFSPDVKLVSPSVVIDSIKQMHRIDSVVTVQLIEILGKPFYQVRCISALQNSKKHDHDITTMNHLADAVTGSLRPPLNEKEAIEVARLRFNGNPTIKRVELLTRAGTHHEYRENPLPAYAVTFDHPSQTTVYVSADLGTVQKFRNNKWRIFDFLWMMHTMDYEGRDNFGNILLRVFSVFGLITVMSGFTLYFVSSRRFRKRDEK